MTQFARFGSVKVTKYARFGSVKVTKFTRFRSVKELILPALGLCW